MSQKTKASASKKPSALAPAPVLRQAMLDTLPFRLAANAVILLPAIPALLDHYVEGLCTTWATLGRHFGQSERERLRESLRTLLTEAFGHSASSRLRLAYDTDPAPGTSLTWKASIVHATMEDEYGEWTRTRTDSLFGRYPDAKVMDLARTLGAPQGVSILDVGAGTGRNTLPLAREGFRVAALEVAPALIRILREATEEQKLDVAIFEGNMLDPTLELGERRYDMVFLSEVVSHFRNSTQLRNVLERAVMLLVPGGKLLFNAFLPVSGYKPDDLARQISEVMWCKLFTRFELAEAASGLPLVAIAEDNTLDYEREHLPAEQWPPTPWYEDWCSGRNAFKLPAAKSPMAARWLTYRKLA